MNLQSRHQLENVGVDRMVENLAVLHADEVNFGGVAPIIVVPGRWSKADLRFQAEHVASQIMDDVRGTFVGELYNQVGVCVMDTGYEGAAV